MTGIYFLAGAAFGLISIAPFYKASAKTLADLGFLALAMMLMIYVGAYLTMGDMPRLISEVLFSYAVLMAALFFRAKYPPLVGGVILMHGLYDVMLGHHAGVPDWYPAMCGGFDLIVGVGLFFLIRRAT